MDIVFAKLRTTSLQKHRKILSTKELVFPEYHLSRDSSVPYQRTAILDGEQMFYIEKFNSDYGIDATKKILKSEALDPLGKEEVPQIDYLIIYRTDTPYVFFQNITPARLIAKKRLTFAGKRFVFREETEEITIQDRPDAIYDMSTDTLYFYKLESITGIFKKIISIYKQETQTQTEQFLSNDFIALKEGFSAQNVNTTNRKLIVLATDTLKELQQEETRQQKKLLVKIPRYIHKYCPDLKYQNGQFEIGSERELKTLLYGIEQRFYRTEITRKSRIANSVMSLDTLNRVNDEPADNADVT